MSGQHARLSPSGSHRWLTCAGSIVLESAFPDLGNEFSDAGTAMHTVAAEYLADVNMYPVSNAIGYNILVTEPGEEPERHVLFTHEHAEIVQGYIDTVRGLVTPGSDLFVEQRVEFSEFVGVPDQFGTADVILLRPNADFELHADGTVSAIDYELILIDLKTGFRFVPVEHNTQLMLYALGALRRFELSHAPTSVRLMIYQPAHGGMREWVCSIADLMVFAATAHEAAQRVEEATRKITHLHAEIEHFSDSTWEELLRDWEKTYLNPDPTEDSCAFCKAMSTCPAQTAKVQRLAMSTFEVIDESKPIDLNAGSDRLSIAMKSVGAVEDWCKAVRAEVERRLLAQIPVEGFGLELGREGNRSWRDIDEAEKYVTKTLRLSIKQAYHMKLISPTDAEKLAGYSKGKKLAKPKTEPIIGAKQWTKLQTMIVRSEAVPSVKRIEDITEPYVPVSPDSGVFEVISETEDLT